MKGGGERERRRGDGKKSVRVRSTIMNLAVDVDFIK